MPLLYRRNGDDTATWVDGEFEDHRVLLFDPVLERHDAPLGNLFRALDPSDTTADVIVFRGGPELLALAEADPVLQELLADRSVYCLVPAANDNASPALVHVPWSRSDLLADLRAGVDLVDKFRTIEVNAVLTRHGAIWRAGPEKHFALPSGMHADAFIRIAEAMGDWVDVARIVDWIMPYLTPDTVVLADTGGMLAVLLQLRIAAADRCGWRIDIDAFQQYPKGPPDVQEVLSSLARDRGVHRPILFLVSVNSSGRLVSMVRGLAGTLVTVVTLCDTLTPGAPKIPALTSERVRRWVIDADGQCDECQRTQARQIDARTYELSEYAGKPVALEPNMVKAAEHKEFWEAAYRTSAVHLHYNVTVNGREVRHQPVYIDVAALLEDGVFRQEAVATLRRALEASRPEVVVVVRHGATPALRALLVETLAQVDDLPTPVIVEADAAAFTGEIHELIGNADRILVLDDAVVTSATVEGLRARIYHANQRYQKNAVVGLFTVVFRPARPDAFRAVSNRYSGPEGPMVWTVEKLLLPREGAKHCPWCRELRALRLWASQIGNLSQVYVDRLERLTRPLMSPLLMGDSDEQAELRTEQSFWGTLDEVTAFAAVSSVMTDIVVTLNDPTSDPRQQYAGLRLTFDAYYDQSIRAAVLRTLDGRHIRHPIQDPMLAGWIGKLGPAVCTPGLLAELAYAAALAKIPYEPVLDLLHRCDDGSDHHAVLRRLVEVGAGVDFEVHEDDETPAAPPEDETSADEPRTTS